MTMTEERVALPAATFSVTGGLAADYVKRGQMIPWAGTLVVEGTSTGDKRSIEMGALDTRSLPMPMMTQLENPVNGDGHDGAVLTGRIDTLERRDDGSWFATGFIDPTMADGDTVALALDKQLIRGVSVDLDRVAITELQGKDGPRQVITQGRIIGATITPFQAFAECEIALDVDRMALAASADFAEWDFEVEGRVARVTTRVDGIETLIASAGSGIPVDPPLEWFAKRKFTELTPLTVLPNGQVFGHVCAAGTCHISFANKCEPVPRSHTNYAKFRCGSTLTAEGTMVRTGPIVMDTVHPDLRWKASDAQSFYANTGAAICDVVPYDDEFGMAVVGAMRPDVSPARMRAFRGSDISPDWRNIDGFRRECCALLAVNNSGFKLPIALAASAGLYVDAGDTAIALDPDDEVYALVASGPMRAVPCCAECAAEHDAVVADAVLDADPERVARLAAVRSRFAVEAAVKRDDELDDERAMRREAVRARFGPKPARVFRVASAATLGVMDGAEFAGTSEGAKKAWESRGRAGLPPGYIAEQTPAERSAAIRKEARRRAARSVIPNRYTDPNLARVNSVDAVRQRQQAEAVAKKAKLNPPLNEYGKAAKKKTDAQVRADVRTVNSFLNRPGGKGTTPEKGYAAGKKLLAHYGIPIPAKLDAGTLRDLLAKAGVKFAVDGVMTFRVAEPPGP